MPAVMRLSLSGISEEDSFTDLASMYPPVCFWHVSASRSFKESLLGERKIFILTECLCNFLLRWLQHHLGFIAKNVPRFTGTFVRVCTQFYLVFTSFVVKIGRGNIKSNIGEMRIIKEANVPALFQAGDSLKYGKILFYISYGSEIACFTPETQYKKS